jgi:4-cresol dehydrogenase (hydroxylating)
MLDHKFNHCLERIVGKHNIITDVNSINLAETTNYKTSEKIHAIIMPSNTAELSECVKEVNKHHIQIHPVSKGKNWGYGSRVPVADNSVLIDLGKMNKILDYNEELAYVTIEPGVTFQQLYDFLRERKSQLIISTTGGSPDSSIMANALERGIGTGLYAERFANICGLEVVLPNGDIVSTGMARFGNNTAAKLYKWGMGPSMDGLFSQSNYGIVSKMTVWLMKSPEYFKLIFYKIGHNQKLPIVIDALRELAMSGVVRPAITVYNDFRTLSTMVQYPWAKCTPGQSTATDVLNTIRAAIPLVSIVGEWNGEISIRAVSKEHADIQSKIVEEAIRALVDEVVVVEVTKEEISKLHQMHYETKNIPHEANIIKSFLVRKYIGIPDSTAIKQAYWRKKLPPPADMNPDRDKCGMIWICPIVPFTGKDVAKANEIIESIIEKHGFEPSVSLQCLSERAINVIVSISWDREIDGEDDKAEACYNELSTSLGNEGYYAYRNTTKGMQLKEKEVGEEDPYMVMLNKIKHVLDPENILSTGRYNISG